MFFLLILFIIRIESRLGESVSRMLWGVASGDVLACVDEKLVGGGGGVNP